MVNFLYKTDVPTKSPSGQARNHRLKVVQLPFETMSHADLALTHTNLYFSALYAETLTSGIYCVLFVLSLLKLAYVPQEG